MKNNDLPESLGEYSAGNGLLNRRALLGLSIAGAGSLLIEPVMAQSNRIAALPPWMTIPGPGASPYGKRSEYVGHIARLPSPANPLSPGTGASRSPLQWLRGSITPNSLHFERHHSGVPAIDPSQHRLLLHGMVRKPLAFSYEDLLRYPLQSHVHFLECSGNSGANYRAPAQDRDVATLHGLVSCAEWTGVPLSILLDEAGPAKGASWIAATGADAASVGRSIPLDKALGDAMIALYQNGEPIRPEQGFPMRLLVPGWEGSSNIKWLTQLKVSDQPAYFRDETSKYTDPLPNGKSLQFTFPMGVKSVITNPSGKMQLPRPGIYEITGIAWSGHGTIRRVEVSADGGNTWADALITSTPLPVALTRFRIPWHWQGGTAVLMSRATDDKGNVQPTRAAVLAKYGPGNGYHFNGIQSWAVAGDGKVKNVYV